MTGVALRGVNLTGWLMLESWVTPKLFAESGALDEASLVVALGEKRFQELVKEHRETFLSSHDFLNIASRGFNAVRIPVPWYVLGADGPNPGSYLGCISNVDDAFDWAEEIGLKIVLALAVSPGVAGAEGQVAGTDDFLHYRDALIGVVSALAKRYAYRDGFFGIELLDEPKPQQRHGLTMSEGVPMHMLRNYYRDAYDAVRSAAGEDPVVIMPSAGLANMWSRFMAQNHYKNVWLDSHLYPSTESGLSVGPAGVRRLAQESEKSLRAAKRCGLPVMVGKWSGALPYADSLITPEGRIALERIYIAEQISVFKHCPAWFFQTWKTEARLAGWDARIALAAFERRMLS